MDELLVPVPVEIGLVGSHRNKQKSNGESGQSHGGRSTGSFGIVRFGLQTKSHLTISGAPGQSHGGSSGVVSQLTEIKFVPNNRIVAQSTDNKAILINL